MSVAPLRLVAGPLPDDRVFCDTCGSLSGRRCVSAAATMFATFAPRDGDTGEILASAYDVYEFPPGRCLGFQPLKSGPDQRTGPQRWPGLIERPSAQAEAAFTPDAPRRRTRPPAPPTRTTIDAALF